MKRRVLLVIALLGVFQTLAAAAPPQLVLQITVDQLRGDMLPRYRDRFGTGGFRRLMDHWLRRIAGGPTNHPELVEGPIGRPGPITWWAARTEEA